MKNDISLQQLILQNLLFEATNINNFQNFKKLLNV